MTKMLYIIAGANGSGKTTLARELIPDKSILFLNVDDIALDLNPSNVSAVRLEAGKLFLKKLDELLKKEESFAIETTLSGTNHVKTIQKAKQHGFDVKMIFVFLKNPEACINRINVRVKKGGHYVPIEDVIRRYYRGINNFWNKYKDIVDSWSIVCNSTEIYLLMADKDENEIKIFDENAYQTFLEDLNI